MLYQQAECFKGVQPGKVGGGALGLTLTRLDLGPRGTGEKVPLPPPPSRTDSLLT